MSDIAQIISAIGVVIAAVAAVLSVVIGKRVYHMTNSRMTELTELVRKSAYRNGMLEGAEEERRRAELEAE